MGKEVYVVNPVKKMAKITKNSKSERLGELNIALKLEKEKVPIHTFCKSLNISFQTFLKDDILTSPIHSCFTDIKDSLMRMVSMKLTSLEDLID